jgi:hypothetical protein
VSDILKYLKVPNIMGKKVDLTQQKNWKTAYFIKLITVENKPAYEVNHVLDLGRDVGDIIIDDPSLGARQLQFRQDDDVLSVMIYPGGQDTFLNQTLLKPGRNFILTHQDEVIVGELRIKIEAKLTEISIPDAKLDKFEDTQDEPPEFVHEVSTKEVEEDLFEDHLPSLDSLPSIAQSGDSSHFLIRLLAFVYDIMIYFIVIELIGLENCNEFADLVLPYEIPIVGARISFFVGLFFIVRAIQGASLRITIGQWLAGIRTWGEFKHKQVGFLIREIIYLLTFPFIVFDLPCFASKANFSEKISKSFYYTKSKKLTILFMPFILVSLSAVLVFAPFVEGGKPVEAIILKENIIKQYNKPNTGVSFIQLNWFSEITNLYSLPTFNFSRENKKIKLAVGIQFYDLLEDSLLKLSSTESFSMRDILLKHWRLDPMFEENYPLLVKYLHAATKTEQASLRISANDDLLDFIKDTLTISFSSGVEFMQEKSPFLISYINSRRRIEALLNIKSEEIVGITRVANGSNFIYIENEGVKPLIKFLPIDVEANQIYQMQAIKGKRRILSFSKVIKNLGLTHSLQTPSSSVGVWLLIKSMSLKKKINVDETHAQQIWVQYFELAKKLVETNNQEQINFLLNTIKDIEQLLGYLQGQNQATNEELSYLKGYFSSLTVAIKEKNLSYFSEN